MAASFPVTSRTKKIKDKKPRKEFFLGTKEKEKKRKKVEEKNEEVRFI